MNFHEERIISAFRDQMENTPVKKLSAIMCHEDQTCTLTFHIQPVQIFTVKEYFPIIVGEEIEAMLWGDSAFYIRGALNQKRSHFFMYSHWHTVSNEKFEPMRDPMGWYYDSDYDSDSEETSSSIDTEDETDSEEEIVKEVWEGANQLVTASTPKVRENMDVILLHGWLFSDRHNFLTKLDKFDCQTLWDNLGISKPSPSFKHHFGRVLADVYNKVCLAWPSQYQERKKREEESRKSFGRFVERKRNTLDFIKRMREKRLKEKENLDA